MMHLHDIKLFNQRRLLHKYFPRQEYTIVHTLQVFFITFGLSTERASYSFRSATTFT